MHPIDVDGWPAASHEERRWDPATDVRDSFGPHRATPGPYRATVPASIADREIVLSPATRAMADDAAAELIRFDTEHGRDPHGVARLLVVAEATASSAIERVTSTAAAVMRAEREDAHDPASNQIVSHVRAIDLATSLPGRFSEDGIVAIQRSLMASSRPERRGRWRDQQVWIGGGALGPQRASFIPPHQSRLDGIMRDFTAFARRDDLPALPQIAIAHAQYETIHPFLEVNGRTGRCVMQTMLRRTDLTRSVVAPLSAGLLQDTAAYFDALTAYRSGRIDEIVRVFTGAAFTSVANARELIDDLVAIRESWRSRTTARRGSAARRLLDVLEQHPVINSRNVAADLEVTVPNAQLAIDRLVQDGILSQLGDGRRNRYWAAHDVLDALDAFAERARRRR
jgi:Fic family protein